MQPNDAFFVAARCFGHLPPANHPLARKMQMGYRSMD